MRRSHGSCRIATTWPEHRRAESAGLPAGLEARYAARREEVLEVLAELVQLAAR